MHTMRLNTDKFYEQPRVILIQITPIKQAMTRTVQLNIWRMYGAKVTMGITREQSTGLYRSGRTQGDTVSPSSNGMCGILWDAMLEWEWERRGERIG